MSFNASADDISYEQTIQECLEINIAHKWKGNSSSFLPHQVQVKQRL